VWNPFFDCRAYVAGVAASLVRRGSTPSPKGGSASRRSLSGAEVVPCTFRRRRRRGRRRRLRVRAAVARDRFPRRGSQPTFLGFVTSKNVRRTLLRSVTGCLRVPRPQNLAILGAMALASDATSLQRIEGEPVVPRRTCSHGVGCSLALAGKSCFRGSSRHQRVIVAGPWSFPAPSLALPVTRWAFEGTDGSPSSTRDRLAAFS
jgi:hypothetical protein